jgi:ATP adenylyltransferase
MDTRQQDRCVFCERLVSGASASAWDASISETDVYLIVPTKGSLVPGWLLVVSKQHRLCSGELRQSELAGLERAIEVAKEIVEHHFGAATIFEHGPASPGTSLGCGIDHLHFHVAPLKFSLITAVNLVIPSVHWQILKGLGELRSLHGKGVGYATVGEPNADMMWFQPPPGIRQPLRRAIASQLGSPELFDYAAHPHEDNVLRTLEQIAVGV